MVTMCERVAPCYEQLTDREKRALCEKGAFLMLHLVEANASRRELFVAV